MPATGKLYITPGPNYPNGDITVTARFKNASDALADPSALVAKSYSGSNTEISSYTYGTDAQVAKTSTGVFTFTFRPNTGGQWRVRLEATISSAAVVLEGLIPVQASPFVDDITDAYRP